MKIQFVTNKALSVKTSSLKRTGLSYNKKVRKAQMTANELINRFNAPQNELFFLKCAWHLSEETIWSIYERSINKKMPLNYFVVACKDELRVKSQSCLGA